MNDNMLSPEVFDPPRNDSKSAGKKLAAPIIVMGGFKVSRRRRRQHLSNSSLRLHVHRIDEEAFLIAGSAAGLAKEERGQSLGKTFNGRS